MGDIADGNFIFRRVCHSFRALGAERAAKFDTSDPVETEPPHGGARLVYIRSADDLHAAAYLCPVARRGESSQNEKRKLHLFFSPIVSPCVPAF